MPNGAKIRITRVVDPDELVTQIRPKMENLGQAIGARAQRLVPKKSWALHDTITAETEVRGNRVVTVVGAGSESVDYALFVERGTSRMAAQPYLRPALMQVRGSDLAGGGRGIMTHGVMGTARTRRRTRGGS